MTQEQRKGVMCDICNEDLRVDVNKKEGEPWGDRMFESLRMI